MKCSQDVKYDIIDKIGRDLTTGGLFQYGANRQELTTQASEAEVKAYADRYNEMFKESILSYQKVEGGYVVTVAPSEALAQKYLRDYAQSYSPAYDTNFSEEQEDRSYIIDNTGPNTDRQINFFPAANTLGAFEQFVRHKEQLKTVLNQRLAQISRDLKDPKLSVDKRTQLNDLKQSIKLRLDGDVHRGIKGLTQEINDLTNMADINAVGYYVEQDLARLAAISRSNNATELREAQLIIQFYDDAGTFQNDKENPFFKPDEMFFTDAAGNLTPEYKLSAQVMQQFMEWRNTAMGFQPSIDMKEKEITTNTFNADAGVRRLYGTEFNFDEIVHTEEGLKDVDWVSAWAMDVTQSIFSKSAELAQVMHTYLVNSMERHLNWSRDYAHRMEEITPRINKRLGEIDGGKFKLKAFGIIGVNGVSYDLYLDKTKNGQQTGTLIQRFTKEYSDASAAQGDKFARAFENARAADDTVKAAAFNKAFEENKVWKRANTVMMQVSLIPEITNNPEFAEFKQNVSQSQVDAHQKYLKNLLGERGYQEEVVKQETLLRKYLADRQSYINSQMIFEGVSDEADLTPASQFAIKQWTLQHSPLTGQEDYFNANGVWSDNRKINTFMDYNNLVPRANKVKITAGKNGSLNFEDQDQSTGYYNDDFKTIEGDDTLREFYDLIKEGNDRIREATPYDLQRKVVANTLPMLLKNTSEFLLDNNNGTLSMISAAWRRLMERIRLSFGLVKQSEISYAIKDPITGKYNYQINDQFLQGNSRAISERMTIESTKFVQAFNVGNGAKINKVSRFTVLDFALLNRNALAHIAEMMNIDITQTEIDAGQTQKIRAVTGDKVAIGNIIRDYATHTTVLQQSFDLPKLMKHFTNLAMAYAARTEALPVMTIMKKHYDSIKDPKTNNVGNPIFNRLEETVASESNRKNAEKQMEDWFGRVMLDNYGLKHWGVHGLATQEKVDDDTKEITTKIPWYGKQIYSNEEKKKIKEIDALLSKEKDPEKIKELRAIKEGFGKVRTASAGVLNFLSMVRTLGLGWNLSSALTNFMEGYTSNMIIASTGEYFKPEEIYYAYSVTKHSWLKNTTFGLLTTPQANKSRVLMDRFNVLMDSKNELQKSTTKTNLSKLEALNPHEINARVEYINQSPIMIAMLRSTMIQDSNGNESSIWDAMDKEGQLTGDFRTADNIANWEKLTGQEYLTFKNRLNEAIVKAHGNYDETRGMMVKSNLAGKALMMFKTWLPTQLYWRFANEQANLKTGTKIKGRYRSFTPGSATVFGMGVGLVAFGPVGAAVGGLGFLAGKFAGMQTEMGALKEMVYTTQSLFKKAIGMPVNMIAGRNLINSKDDFEKWVGSGRFTETDAKNMRGNMSELAILMTSLALMLLVKSFFWDDDDEKDSVERQFHNYAVNKLLQLSQQATMYVKPSDLYETTFGSIAVFKFLQNLGKEVDKIQSLMSGHDPGASKLKEQTMKFLPGMFRDGLPFQNGKLGFGFNTQAEKQFTPTPYDEWFHSEETKEKKHIKELREVRNEELKQQGYTDKGQRTKILNIEIPTPSQLKKKGMTREEYMEQLGEVELPEPIKKKGKQEEAEQE